MASVYIDGFETCADDSDFRTRGWVTPPVKLTAAFGPSATNMAGTGLRMVGAGSTNTTANGAAGAVDLGYYNTGVTVNQAWQAGGFSFAFSGKFNGGVVASYGSGQSANSNQVCFDGTRYWALRLISAVYTVVYSTDLINWTVCAAQPATTLWVQSTISYLGGGVIGVVSNNTTGTNLIVYYTSNLGTTWASNTLATVGNAQNGSNGVCLATGNASFPHAVLTVSVASSAIFCGGLWIGTVSGTMTQVVSITGANFVAMARPRAVGSLLVMPITTGNLIFSATAANSSLNTTGAWSTATLSTTVTVSDITYHPVSNLWVIASASGMWTIPNAGAPGTPVALTGSVTPTVRYSLLGMQNVWLVGNTLVAHGLQGHIITSPDGVTWTEAGSHILPVGTSGIDWRASLYDGSRYVLFSDATTGVIAATPDLQTNYTAQYVMEGTERATTSNGWGHTGIYSGTAPNPSTGLWTATGGIFAVALQALSAGARPIAIITASTGQETSYSIPNASTTLQHFYELVAIASPGTVNGFTHNLLIDGVLVYQGAGVFQLGSGTSDTTSLIILQFERFNAFTVFDDVVFALNNGVGLSGPFGQIMNIVARRPTTDVQAQFNRVGSASSNAGSVRQTALSSSSANSVNSYTVGNKDLYSSSDSIPANFSVKAISVEAVFSKGSITTPAGTVGLLSGGTESDSSPVSVTSSSNVFVSKNFDTDPNGNVAWTNTNALAAEFALNKTT